jgi:hypothetical protein
MKVIVGRPIEGVAMNGDEYLSNEEGKTIVFSSQEEALTFMVMVTDLDYEQAANAFDYYEVEVPVEDASEIILFEDYAKSQGVELPEEE